jgi:hypothetical protein
MLLKRCNEDEMARLEEHHRLCVQGSLTLAQLSGLCSGFGQPLGDSASSLNIRKGMSKLELVVALRTGLGDQFVTEHIEDYGFWTWLCVQFAGELLSSGRPVRDLSTILAVPNHRTWYRHRLRGPLLIARAHGYNVELLRTVLFGSVDVGGELYEQIGARKQLWNNPEVLRFLNRLYFDDAKKALRKGASGAGACSAREIAPLWMQIDRTIDLDSCSAERLFEVFPAEFLAFCS